MAELPFFGHVIDNEEVESVDGRRFDVWNPWTREVWAQAAEASEKDAELAVESARRAFDEGPWPRMGRVERARAIHRLADLMEERADDLARLDSTNMAKPIGQARHDVARSVWNFRFFADHQRDHVGEVYPMDSGHHTYSEYGPAGVVAAISPWNFPLMMASWKIAPAIAWGNTCIIKPSEDTPASVTMLGRLAVEAGFPPGVLNVVNGYGVPAGATLTGDDRVDRVTFTGSSATGRQVMASAATHLAPVSLELGGKGANIVFEDADVDNAVHWAVEAGFPPGVLNVVNGYGAPAGSTLTGDDRVDRVTFTGSSTTGRQVMASAATHLAPVSLELGGKGANIVFEDADVDNAVHWAVEAIFRNAGQICLAGSRLFVHSSLYDEFMRRFVEAAEALTIGDPFDPATRFSSLASKRHFDKVVSYVESAQALGGTIHTGGVADDGSWVVRPTVIDGLALDSAPYCEEIFGPVCVVNSFDTEDEVVGLANDTRYGLNAMLFTENLSRAHRVASRLRAGTVWVNCFFIRDLRTPFGGVGDSGVGREGGNFSREFFTEPKAVVMQIDR